MAGELRIMAKDGTVYWFGRDEHFPQEVRQYTGDAHHWKYVPTREARALVREVLDRGGIVDQGDAALFFRVGETPPG
ncbi:MAG: hypothetical protein QJR03_05940 [Sphaerobacter sp.]|nr:hypothetical protein [Sphaerobacter sp.]